MANKKEIDRLSQQPGFGPSGSEEYQPKRKLDFSDEEAEPINVPAPLSPIDREGKKNALMQMLSSLGNTFADNRASQAQLMQDEATIGLDRLKMANPNKIGPRLPDEPLPREKEYMDSLGGIAMGSVSPVGKVVKSAPWMKGITKEATDSAIAQGEGLATRGGPAIREYLQKLKALSKRY